jgi:hypothetical protein
VRVSRLRRVLAGGLLFAAGFLLAYLLRYL